MSTIFEFINVDPTFTPQIQGRHNVSGIVGNPIRRYFLKVSEPVRGLIRPMVSESVRSWGFRKLIGPLTKKPLDPELRLELTAYFREDILKTQDLIDRDLSHWLS